MRNTKPLPNVQKQQKLYVDTVTNGQPILPIERIRLYSGTQWEEFVLEWAHALKSKYCFVERCGGAGDMGRDIIAYPKKDNYDIWDNYQCKHYDHPLRPSDIWIELGKFVYYTYICEYSCPRKYMFVAPQGAGTTLAKLLKMPEELRQKLISNWDGYCRNEITKNKDIPLDSEMLDYLNKLDFSIFGYIPPLHLIDEHCSTPYHYARFGGRLPDRPDCPIPPDKPASTEMIYLKKLFEAYGDHLKHDVQNHSDIEHEHDLKDHYIDSRFQFYSAESLRNFSRDTLPEGIYDELQEEIHDGIRDIMRDKHDDGYRRVIAVVKEARQLHLTSNPLLHRLTIRDRGGICHQLANDRDEVRWVK